MTLQELSDAWNALDVAALGRGTRAPVSPELAKDIRFHSAMFRAWMAELGPFDELRERVLASDDARRWVAVYNRFRSQVKAQGRAVPGELVEPRGALGELADAGRTIAFVALAGVAAVLFLRRKGGR